MIYHREGRLKIYCALWEEQVYSFLNLGHISELRLMAHLIKMSARDFV